MTSSRRYGAMRVCGCLAMLWMTAVVAAAPPVRIDPDDPPKGTFCDDWYAVTLMGRKCGYMHSTMTRKADKELGRDVVESVTEMKLTLGRAGQGISVGTREVSVETVDGRIIRFSSRTDASLMSVQIDGTVKDGRVTVVTKQLGQTNTRTYDLPEGAVMGWGALREQLKRGLNPGLRYRLLLYSPSMSAEHATPVSFEVVGKEQIDLYGRVVEAFKTRQTMSATTLQGDADVHCVVWVDERCQPLMLEMTMPFVQQPFRMLQCSKAVALKEADPPELMAETLIPAELPAGADRAKAIVWRIARKAAATTQPAQELPEPPTTAMQEVKRLGPGEFAVRVMRSGEALKAPAKSPETKAVADALRGATAFLNIDDPEIKRLAKEAAGGAKDPMTLARRLRRFVSEYVHKKDLGVGFATASEVARSRQGDCSEHAVLLAALARACGLPSRGVSGVVHASSFADRDNVFVWHMWTQVWIDGRWVDLDAALEQDDLDPTHIAMGLVTFSDSGLADMAVPIWNLIGQITIEAVSVEKQQRGR